MFFLLLFSGLDGVFFGLWVGVWVMEMVGKCWDGDGGDGGDLGDGSFLEKTGEGLRSTIGGARGGGETDSCTASKGVEILDDLPDQRFQNCC